MGDSSPPPPGMTLDTLANDVALTIRRLADGPAVVVGHAYGHWVARVTDLRHPSLVRGVVVLGAAAKEFPPGLVEQLAIASDPAQPEARRLQALQASMFAPGHDPRPWLEGWYPQWRTAYRQAGQQPPKDVWFGRTHSPILDLQGAQDPWRPLATRNELKDLLPDRVTVQVIEHASHALVPEQPKAVADAIVGWIGRLPPR
ncbi:alpha/beta fold hydrolase [Aquabacterium sp. J223]|uniref:alpha/beta fold hydrolase n=1 Tax=Aquabacterium sp. J223 TaxID=2898431 RepID=UPI0021AE1376|nr:alpha/beta hydrolase [Aquabacterium sp. J223]UUX95011.1 alpha/beta hydrolase [Aquabacterium sp. J223]